MNKSGIGTKNGYYPTLIIEMIRIMILDDEKLIRWSLDQILVKDGYAVDTAASTSEAPTAPDG